MRSFILILLGPSLALCGTNTVKAADITNESLATIKRHIDNDKAVLVDVREKSEWDVGHVAGAIFLPLSAVRDGLSKEELARLPKGKVLYAHCEVGRRALTAGNVIERYGFTVKVVKPGSKQLVEAGFPPATE